MINRWILYVLRRNFISPHKILTFDFSKNRHDAEPQGIEYNGKRIYNVIV